MSLSPLPYTAPLQAAPADRSASARWIGRILTGLAVAFLLFDAAIKLLPNEAAITGTTALGYEPHHLPIIGVIALACLVLYVVPRTAVLGAVLWTGYFDRNAPASGQPALYPHALPGLRRGAGLGRTLPARRPRARAPGPAAAPPYPLRPRPHKLTFPRTKPKKDDG